MRKINREVKDLKDIKEILNSCQTIRIGINGSDYPYVVPVSFGFEENGEGKIVIYFHGAGMGHKHDLLARDNRVCVEADILYGYVDLPQGSVTADYKSVIGFGTAERVDGYEEKVRGLRLLLEHCGTPGYSAEECALRAITVVYRVTLSEITGKQRFKAGK